MDFLNLTILAGLAAASLPVIIHLLNRRKARVIDWGAMRFLELSVATRGRRVLLEEVLLLLLRTALLIVLVLAMARPLLVNPYFAGPGAASQDVVLLLDGSMSMGVCPAGPGPGGQGPYFERARKAALQAIDRLAPGDAVAVVLAGATPQRLTGHLTFDRELARRAVSQARPTDGTMNVTDSLSLAGRILDEGKNAHKQVLVITDGRSHGWRIDSAEDWQSLAGRLASYRRTPRIQVLELGRGVERPGSAEPLVNLAIEQVRLSRPVIGTDLPVVVTATVRNTGQLTSPHGVRLTLRVIGPPGEEQRASGQAEGADSDLAPAGRGEPDDAQVVPELAAMAQATTQLRVHFARPGPHRLMLDLDFNDALAADNRLVHAVDILETLPVLLVNGDANAVPDQDECFWLRSAFQPRLAPAPADRGEQPIEFLVAPTIVEPPLLGQQDFNRYYAVVLANVNRVTPEVLARLAEFVAGGGGLLVAPGDKADREFYNQVLFAAGRGLLPAALGEPAELKAGEPGQTGPSAGRGPPVALVGSFPTSLPDDTVRQEPLVSLGPAPAGRGHPALIGSAEPTLWEPVRAFRHFPLTPADGAEVATVLWLSTGAVFGYERLVGLGRVVVLGGPLDAAWSNLPLHNAYVLLVNELAYHLSAPRRTTLNLAANQLFSAPVPADGATADAQVRTPLGQTIPLTRVFDGGQWKFKFGQTAEPGLYELRFQPAQPGGGHAEPGQPIGRQAGADGNVLYFTVQRDCGESFLALLDDTARQRVSRSLAGVQFHAHTGTLLDSLRVADPGREIWKLLAMLVLAMLLAEVWLARRITRHRHGQLSAGVRFGERPVHMVR